MLHHSSTKQTRRFIQQNIILCVPFFTVLIPAALASDPVMHVNADNSKEGMYFLYEYRYDDEASFRTVYMYFHFDTVVEVSYPKRSRPFFRSRSYTFSTEYGMLSNVKYRYVGHTSSPVLKRYAQELWLSVAANVDFTKGIQQGHSVWWYGKEENSLEDKKYRKKIKGYPSFFYPAYLDHDMVIALSYYDLASIEQLRFYSTSNVYSVEMRMEYEGIETISVPAGTLECYRLEIYPKSLLWRVLAKDITVWLSAEHPEQFMVRHENYNSMPGTPRGPSYRLVEYGEMSPEEWEAKKESFYLHLDADSTATLAN